MSVNHISAQAPEHAPVVASGDTIASWLESQYCARVAAALLARTEYFELLEDAMVSPVRLSRALTAWRQHASEMEVLGGLIGTA